MSPAQQRLGVAGLNSCCSRFSATPAAVELLLRHGLNPRRVYSSGEGFAYGLECRPTHEPGDAVPADQATSRPQFLMDPRGAVKAAVLLEHRCHLSGDGSVLLGPGTGVLLPLPPGVEAAAGHSQLLAQPEHRKADRQGLDQAKPLGGSCSLAKCAAASLKKSFSLLSSRISLRSWASSALSSLVS